MTDVVLPPELQGYQTYINAGPDPRADRDADARLDRRRPRSPDTKDKNIYFVAIPDGGGKHAFAKDNASSSRSCSRSTGTS